MVGAEERVEERKGRTIIDIDSGGHGIDVVLEQPLHFGVRPKGVQVCLIRPLHILNHTISTSSDLTAPLVPLSCQFFCVFPLPQNAKKERVA